MAEKEKKIRGGGRATLALILAIIALVISLIAYQRSGGNGEDEVSALKAKIAELKKGEEELRKKMANVLEKVADTIKKEEPAEEKKGK